jgi:ribonuclease HI
VPRWSSRQFDSGGGFEVNEMNTLIINCDGLCEPKNPGGYGCWGWVSEYNGRPLKSRRGSLGKEPSMTNNRAEYAAVLDALLWLYSKRVHLFNHRVRVVIRSDSKLVINQINGDWACNSENLISLNKQATDLVSKLFLTSERSISFEWVPRAENEAADALSRAAYAEALNNDRQEVAA